MTPLNKPTLSLLLLTSITASTPLAQAGVIRHDRDDALYQALANESQFAPVAQLQVFGPSGLRNASGTLISSEWVLTAAHIFDGIANPGGAVVIGAAFSMAAEVIINPGWSEGQYTQGNDLALVRISSPFLNVTPAQIYSGSNELGQVGTGVGYGRSGTGLTGGLFGVSGTKRAGTNVIDALGSDRGWNESIMITDFDRPDFPNFSTYGSAIPTDLEYQVAPGDSGGALYIQENGQYLLAGVTSFINAIDGNPNGSYGDMSAYTRVSDYSNWINSIIPAPSGLVILSAGILTATRRRRTA